MSSLCSAFGSGLLKLKRLVFVGRWAIAFELWGEGSPGGEA